MFLLSVLNKLHMLLKISAHDICSLFCPLPLPAEVRVSVVDVTTVLSVENVDAEMEVWCFFEDAGS